MQNKFTLVLHDSAHKQRLCHSCSDNVSNIICFMNVCFCNLTHLHYRLPRRQRHAPQWVARRRGSGCSQFKCCNIRKKATPTNKRYELNFGSEEDYLPCNEAFAPPKLAPSNVPAQTRQRRRHRAWCGEFHKLRGHFDCFNWFLVKCLQRYRMFSPDTWA
jgi:hypothetical protein